MATITDNDLKMFQERAKTEFASRCDTGGIAWDSVIWDLCNEVRRLRSISAAKEPPAETRVLKVLMVDDFPGMRGYIEKHMPDVEVTYCARLPDDESVFAQYDALVIDGDGVGNRTYPDGLAFCKSYDKPEGQAVVFHSGLSASGMDARELEWRGIANLPKGYPEKLARCIRFPMPKLIGAADKKPPVFKVGERVDWTDPVTGEKTGLWTVLDVPEIPAEGPSGDEVYRIENDSGFAEEAYARELSYPEGRPL